ncbi:MAG: hypothetical protein LBG68_00175 [Coriobacteriales bacterium]|jgi:hypothetical protein|nr:hypothetical protein [Coriobacteriales bacterium]
MPISMSPRENYLACLNHKPHEYTPGMTDVAMCGMFLPFERGEGGAGVDAFGVRWVAPLSAAGGALPAPGEFLLTDVTKWKDVVKPINPKEYDWERFAALEAPRINRDGQAVEVASLNFIYERLATLMGFEGALLAMALEPEATYELLEFLLEWKIEVLKYYVKYYKPDIYTFFDDVATERMLFMSPESYQTLLKPLHTRMVKACNELGVIAIQHTCGKADLLVQDMIDEGCAGWSAVQATNNIEEIIQNYGDKFVIIGGYNSNAGPGLPTATEPEVRAEVRRCLDSYGKYRKGYIFFGMVLMPVNPDDPTDQGPMSAVIIDEFMKIRAEQTA